MPIFAGLIGLMAPGATRSAEQPAAADAYRSPYSVNFSYPLKKLLGNIQQGRRGEPHEESSVPFTQWYSASTRKQYGAWGPPARHYPALTGAAPQPVPWQRERIIAVALQFQGYLYQHHHIPDWDPPADWPWKETKGGHNGKGVDCSNFTAFVYNLGLGIKPTGAIEAQSEQLDIPGPGPGRRTRAERVELPNAYAARTQVLRTGDLLFIRNVRGEISHVVLWVGAIGSAPGNVPLIIDSHGEGVRDYQGKSIPCGVYLRPVLEKSWYFRSASHAVRILRDE